MTLYVPAHFRVEDRAELFDFIEANAFGTLVSSGAAGLHVSHIPFIPERGADGAMRLLGHVARANAQWGGLEGAEHPGWYQAHPSVPTWNYAVVHARCTARLMDEAGLRELLRRLSTKYEQGRPSPWRMEDLAEDYVAKLLRVIVGFALEVESLEGKFKLSQNRPGHDAERVSAALEAEGEGALAALMREHPPRCKA